MKASYNKFLFLYSFIQLTRSLCFNKESNERRYQKVGQDISAKQTFEIKHKKY